MMRVKEGQVTAVEDFRKHVQDRRPDISALDLRSSRLCERCGKMCGDILTHRCLTGYCAVDDTSPKIAETQMVFGVEQELDIDWRRVAAMQSRFNMTPDVGCDRTGSTYHDHDRSSPEVAAVFVLKVSRPTRT